MAELTVKTKDTGVVPVVDNPQKIPATIIWVPFDVWKNFHYILAHQIASQLGHLLHQRC